MRMQMVCIIASADLAKATPTFPNPDTVYINVVDLEKASTAQLSSRKHPESFFAPFLGNQVVIEGDCTVKARNSGGLNVQLDEVRITPLPEWEAAQAARQRK